MRNNTFGTNWTVRHPPPPSTSSSKSSSARHDAAPRDARRTGIEFGRPRAPRRPSSSSRTPRHRFERLARFPRTWASMDVNARPLYRAGMKGTIFSFCWSARGTGGRRPSRGSRSRECPSISARAQLLPGRSSSSSSSPVESMRLAVRDATDTVTVVAAAVAAVSYPVSTSQLGQSRHRPPGRQQSPAEP